MNQFSLEKILNIFKQPFNTLLFQAHQVHQQHFDPNAMQASTLMSVKTGACPEDCKYCSQSIHYDTQLEKEKLASVGAVLEAAKAAKAEGATRFCMGAAWRAPSNRQINEISAMVKAVKSLGLETCVTLGMLKDSQAKALKEAGLDYYNHNIDTSEDHYEKVVTTHTFQDRINTLHAVQASGLKVCCGGILGMGETRKDRAMMLQQLSQLSPQPESVPINQLVPIAGTPFSDNEKIDIFEFIKTVCVARILMPKTYIRLSAGREKMTEAEQSLAFFAGCNSIFYGQKLLTTGNCEINQDQQLLHKLGMHLEQLPPEHMESPYIAQQNFPLSGMEKNTP